MITGSIIALSGAGLYLLVSYHKFKLTESISATFYEWGKPPMKYSAAFMLFCLIVAIGSWVNAYYENYEVWTRICLGVAGIALSWVGIASTYKDKKVSTLHYALAVLAIALGFAALSVEYWRTWRAWAPLASFIAVSVAIRFLWPKWATYLIEVVALVIIFSCL